MKQTLCTITSNTEVMPGIHLIWIEAPDIAAAAQPGQFITVRCGDFTLRRPLSIHQVGGNNVIASDLPAKAWQAGAKQSQVALLFKIAGKGTFWLSQRQKGERLDILGPLGNGFTIEPKSKHLLLVAGGIGIKLPPLPNGVQFIPVTEDGSMGQKGMATDILPDFLGWADQMYACGPVDMYKTMAKMSLRVPIKSGRSNPKLKKCQVSLEVRMGCGFGACYGCTINTKKGLKQVCRDGPVFELNDIIWQEVRI
ncbi:MAG: dihydroorotate dehydrogenase electron transfer subunit [Dehalococcoidia bacterium]